MAYLREETVRRGFPTPDGVHNGPCHVHAKHAHTIGPDGSLYACPGFTGAKGLSIGHIDEGSGDPVFFDGVWGTDAIGNEFSGGICTTLATMLTIDFGSGIWTGTLGVVNGGTGAGSFTAYAPIFGGTSSTGPLQSGTVGTAGQVLTSNGPGAMATFQDAASGVTALFDIGDTP